MPSRIHSPIRTLGLSCAAIALLSAAAHAQGGGGRPAPVPTPQPTQPVPSSAEAQPSGPIISVEFGGGLLRDYVEAVRQAALKVGQGVNIILPKEAETEAIPAITLSQVSVATALEALTFAFPEQSGPAIASKVIGSPTDKTTTFALRFANGRPRNAGLPGQPVFMAPGSQRVSRVHSLRTLIEMPQGVTPDPSLVTPVENVLSALRAAAELEANANVEAGTKADAPPEFLLHKESQLLICRGTENQQKLVESLLVELRESLEPKRARAMENARNAQAADLQRVSLKAEMEQAEIGMRRAEDQMRAMEKQLEDAKSKVTAGTVSTNELEQARARFVATQRNVEEAHANLEAVRARVEIMAARQNAAPAGTTPPPMPPMAGPKIDITYDIKDLEPFYKDLYQFCKAVVPGEWEDQGRYSQAEAYKNSPKDPSRPKYNGQYWVLQMWKNWGNMPMTATPDQHRAIVQYLNTVRRSKANEPNLPGLDAEMLIEKAGKKE